jgi:hypothetical protein
MLSLTMRWIGVIIFLLLLSISAKAQERALEPSSATDASVKIEKGGRVRASSPERADRAKFITKRSKAASGPKETGPRFKDHKKRAVGVSEGGSKVEKTSKRKQKRNNRMRVGGGS